MIKLRFLLFITITSTILLSGCLSSPSEEEVKEFVINELEAHFDNRFGVKDVSYNLLNDSYEFDVYLLKDKTFTLNFILSGNALKSGESSIDGKNHLYRGVVSGLYRRDLKNMMNHVVEKNNLNYTIAHLDYKKPKMVHLEDDKFADMNFEEFSREYKEEILYKVMILIPEEANQNNIINNEKKIKSYLRELEKKHVENINLVLVFSNNAAAYSKSQSIKKLITIPFHEGFSLENNKKPVIPGMNYEKWKKSLDRVKGRENL
jgi:hypothetical protein